MEHQLPQPPPPSMRVVWPEHSPEPGGRSGFELPGTPFAEQEADPTYVPSKWEERFDICQMQAMLHLLEHLTEGLPGAIRRMLLRRADQFPMLHGRFAPFHGRLGFHAEEGEVIGPGECWEVDENGERVRLW